MRTNKIKLYKGKKNNRFLQRKIKSVQVKELQDQVIALKHLHDRMRLLEIVMDELPIIFWGLDENKCFNISEGSGLKYIGINPGEIIGLSALLICKDYPIVIEGIKKTYTEGPQHWLEDVGGVYLDTYTLPTVDDKNKVTGLIGIAINITDRIVMENQLNIAKEVIEPVTKAKNEFHSSMNRIIRNPLNVIAGMAQSAKDMDDIVQMKDCLKKIDLSSKQLLSLLDDVIDFSKRGNGQLMLEHKPFDLENSIADLMSILTLNSSENKRIFVKFDTRLPKMVIGDSIKLNQVIINLMDNAKKFTDDHGGILLEFKEHKRQDKKVNIEISIADDGIGISEELLLNLCKSLQKVDNKISRMYGGIGLGLTMSKYIVQAMDGDITIHSQLGVGCRVVCHVWLEFLEEEKEDTSILSKMSILTVNNRLDICDYISQVTKGFGLNSDAVYCGRDAIKVINKKFVQKSPYHIVLLDWNLPDIDCAEVIEAINLIDDTCSILITYYEYEYINVQALDKTLKKVSFLKKPFLPSKLFDELIGMRTGINFGKSININSVISCPDLSDKRLLLAEDNILNREVVLQMLEPTKIDIAVAHDGLEAVEMFQANPEAYDIILMDIQMPRMDGYKATERIRLESEQGNRVPIIALTANAFRDDVELAYRHAMNGLIAKPIYESVLYNALAKHLLVDDNNYTRINMPVNYNFPDVWPKELPGFMVQEALSRYKGDTDKLRYALIQFTDMNYCKQIGTMLDQSNYEEAGNLSHTLCSVAGHLGLMGISAAARDLNNSVRKGNDDLERRFFQLKKSSINARLYIELIIKLADIPNEYSDL